MKYTLTVQSDDAAEILGFLSRNSGTNITTVHVSDDDDENTPVANVAPGQLDTRGFPWDARIHSKAKSTNKDGSWRRMKGVSDATIAAVEAEYKTANQTPATFPATAPQPVPTFQAPQFSQPQPAPQFVQQPAPTFQAPQPEPAPVQQQIPTGPDFGQLMSALQRGTQTQAPNGAALIDPAYLANLAARVGQTVNKQFSNIMEMQNDPQAISVAMQLMQADGRLV